MAIMQVRSTNPQFSFLIKKNPASGMQLRSIRKGMAYGWYSDEQSYNVYFKDAENEVSYKQHPDESFEYLNVSRYHTPLFPLGAIGEFFSAPLKIQHERDTEGFEQVLFINMIHVELPRYVDSFRKHMQDYAFELIHLEHKSYSLTIRTQRSLYQLLHTTSVLCLFLSMLGNESLDISDSILDKYIKSMGNIDAPFYIRSLFVRNFLSSRSRFNRYRAELERTERYPIRFAFGGTALQRRNYIADVLDFDKSIVDVGCGEGFYALPFASKLEGSYYAIDVNKEALEVVERKAAARELDNIVPLGSFAQFLEHYNGERVDVLLTEVIEHMSREEAGQLIRDICQHANFERLIITTPNADFNRYYELSGYRHEDHKWELGELEFRQWMAELLQGLQYEFVAVGDSVNQVQTTQGVIVRKEGA